MKQVYEANPLCRPRGGAELKIIAFIERRQTKAIEEVLRSRACGMALERTLGSCRAADGRHGRGLRPESRPNGVSGGAAREAGKGSTFTVTLPQTVSKPAKE